MVIAPFFFVDKIDIIAPFIRIGEWMCGPFADKEIKFIIVRRTVPYCRGAIYLLFYGMEG